MPEPISQTNAPGAKSTRCDAWLIGGGSFRAWRLRTAHIPSEAKRVTSA